MNVGQLKEILKDVPDNADILLAANGHSNFTDTNSHGKSRASHVTMGKDNKDVFVFSATNCGFDPLGLNYCNINMVREFS